MSDEKRISRQYFEKRLVDLCVRSGMVDFPKKATDQQILLKSIVLDLRDADVYSEREINERIALWLDQVCAVPQLDFVTLRRALVDEGYLLRTADGSRYEVASSGPAVTRFESEVEDVAVSEVIATAREDVERRRKLYGGG